VGDRGRPCCRLVRVRPRAAGTVPSPTGPASPRSSTWPVPRPWRLLPARELGCGLPATCWRRLTEWADAGVFDQLHLEVLDHLGEHGQLDWSRASEDTMSVRAKRGGPRGRKSSRSWQARKQAPSGLRRWWAAADRRGDCRQRQRPVCSRQSWRTCPRSARRRGGGAPGPPRSTPTKATTAAPTGPTCAVVGSGRGSPAVGRVVDQAGSPSLVGRAVAVMVELLQAAAGAVGP
jgi:hypothetical protein